MSDGYAIIRFGASFPERVTPDPIANQRRPKIIPCHCGTGKALKGVSPLVMDEAVFQKIAATVRSRWMSFRIYCRWNDLVLQNFIFSIDVDFEKEFS
jgi:hypothetical protein